MTHLTNEDAVWLAKKAAEFGDLRIQLEHLFKDNAAALRGMSFSTADAMLTDLEGDFRGWAERLEERLAA